MSKLEIAARQLVTNWDSGLTIHDELDALREALAEQVHTPYCKQAPMCKTPCGNSDCVEQAEQEPEVWYCPDCGTLSELQVKCCPDWIRSRKVTKNFAITCKATFDRNGQAEQEPVAWRWPTHNGYAYAETHFDDEGGEPLYAAPVRTKDLTDDEIAYIWRKYRDHITSTLGFARAVIAADREKNK